MAYVKIIIFEPPGGATSDNTAKIILTFKHNDRNLENKVFAVCRDKRLDFNTYLRGVEIVSVEWGSVVLNLRLDKDITLQDFLQNKLQQILALCLTDELLGQVGETFTLDVEVHSKLNLDLASELAYMV